MSTPKIKINGQWQPLVTIPTTISSFSNDVGYITSAQAPVQSVNGQTGAVVIDDTGTFIVPVTLTWNSQTEDYTATTTIDIEDIIAAAKDGLSVIVELTDTSIQSHKSYLPLGSYQEDTVNLEYLATFNTSIVSRTGDMAEYVGGALLSIKKRQGTTTITFESVEGSIPQNISDLTNDSDFIESDTTANFTVSDTAPSNPQAGDVWIDMSSDGIPMANGVDF